MEIQINKDYRIKSLDSDSIAIQKLVPTKVGGTTWRNIGYYNHLSSALRQITDSAEFVHNCKNLDDLKKHLDRINEIKEEFKSILCP